ncbi:phytosulfokine 2 precursor [Hibiscus trionum]|uniref:Phytosulfokine n=1 Tax=Hibiscus trionum TaxID=183268 RepID=A0A9W7HH36_HIBTR|nr:phytosulfokine 2 precursor [Hibiscus trionum]
MSRLCALFIAAFVFNFVLCHAARPDPTLPLTQHEGVEAEIVDVDDNCEGVDKEECLMRRTLVAHVDYIYTQKHNHP